MIYLARQKIIGYPIIINQKLLIYQKSYALALILYPYINRIPQSHRQVLGKHLEQSAINLLVLTIKANKEKTNARLRRQLELSDELDVLRILIRLTKDLKFISVRQYTYVSEKINAIGRMLKGWMKT